MVLNLPVMKLGLMKQITWLGIICIVIMTINSCSSCKKNVTANNIILYNQPLIVIQQNINGRWRTVYTKGGYSGGTFYLTNQFWEFSNNNRIKVTDNNSILADTTIFWNKNTYINKDSVFIMNFFDKHLSHDSFIIDQILNDTLILHDYASDPFYYYLIKQQ